jgi:hypothetical protein
MQGEQAIDSVLQGISFGQMARHSNDSVCNALYSQWPFLKIQFTAWKDARVNHQQGDVSDRAGVVSIKYICRSSPGLLD